MEFINAFKMCISFLQILDINTCVGVVYLLEYAASYIMANPDDRAFMFGLGFFSINT